LKVAGCAGTVAGPGLYDHDREGAGPGSSGLTARERADSKGGRNPLRCAPPWTSRGRYGRKCGARRSLASISAEGQLRADQRDVRRALLEQVGDSQRVCVLVPVGEDDRDHGPSYTASGSRVRGPGRIKVDARSLPRVRGTARPQSTIQSFAPVFVHVHVFSRSPEFCPGPAERVTRSAAFTAAPARVAPSCSGMRWLIRRLQVSRCFTGAGSPVSGGRRAGCGVRLGVGAGNAAKSSDAARGPGLFAAAQAPAGCSVRVHEAGAGPVRRGGQSTRERAAFVVITPLGVRKTPRVHRPGSERWMFRALSTSRRPVYASHRGPAGPGG